MNQRDVDIPDVDVDVCMGCGRYYGYTLALELIWRRSNPRPGQVMPQLCTNCMEAEYGPAL